MAIEPLPGVAVTPVGALGRVNGVSADDGEEAGLVPDAFVAVTLKVYAVPFASPVIWQVVVLDVHVPMA